MNTTDLANSGQDAAPSSIAYMPATREEDNASSPASSSRGGSQWEPSGPDKKRQRIDRRPRAAEMSTAALEKKRSHDREAQRNKRGREKKRIEDLEKRIQELETQPSHQELVALENKIAMLQCEREALRRQIMNAMNLMSTCQRSLSSSLDPLGPTLSQMPGVLMGQHLPTGSEPPSTHSASTPISEEGSPIPVDENTTDWRTGPRDLIASPDPLSSVAIPNHHHQERHQKPQRQQRHHHQTARGLRLGNERLNLELVLGQPQSIPRIPQDRDPPTLLPDKHGRATVHTGPRPPSVVNGATYPSAVINCPPTCILDEILLRFLHERRQRAAEGMPPAEVIGPRYPSVSSLLNPSGLSHPLSQVFAGILRTFPDLSTLPERVAVLYVMFLIMRWQISGTREDLDRLPEWVIPCRLQQTIPHPAWLDHLPFPLMRERLVQAYGGSGTFPFEEFFIPFTTTLSVNWGYEDADALLRVPGSEEVIINPVFERHIRRNENWTLGGAFAEAFPLLEGTYNLKKAAAGGAW